MKEAGPLVTIEKVSVKMNGREVLQDIGLTIHYGEQWAILGPSGSGKTSFANALTGKNFHAGKIAFNLPGSQSVILVEQQHHFKNLSNTSNFYYQQRFNSMDAEDSLTVKEYLQDHLDKNPLFTQSILDELHLNAVFQKPLIQLSNGENKRLQLAAALLRKPALLILDSPFTGLDTEGRRTLHRIIDKIIESGIHVLLITAAGELPVSITHVAVLKEGRMVYAGEKDAYRSELSAPANQHFDLSHFDKLFTPGNREFDFVIRMKNVHVQYGDKIILDNINWEVRKGERWNISGPNGAGKSTLLSLVNGDNPQAYANEIYLFDRRRGSGESIWDIKKKIGYVSPELHLFFDSSNTCYEVVASGLFDTIGLFRQLTTTQQQQVTMVLELLRLGNLQRQRLFQLSPGQQRMILIARAIIKNPPLLILDEPCQGLDEDQSAGIKTLIDTICKNTDTSLLYVSHYEKDIPTCVDRFFALGVKAE